MQYKPVKRDSGADHPGPQTLPGQHDLSLLDLAGFAWSCRWWVITCTSITGAAALLFIVLATPRYTATTQVFIETRTPTTLREATSERASPIDAPEVESQLILLRSEQIADKTVRRLGLSEDDEFASAAGQPGAVSRLIAELRTLLGGAPLTAASPDADAAARNAAGKALRDRMTARRLDISYVIEISFTADSPDKAARIANGIAETYIEDQLETRAQAARLGAKWLEERIDDLRREMNASALRVKEFRARRDYSIPGSARAETEQATSPADGTTLEELESEASTYRAIYESFLQAFAESVQRQSYPVTNARIITRATAGEKSFPATLRTLIAALVAGALLGLALGFFRLLHRRPN
jgi:uncharacterized protein involved in exopolysaccharide biosynthesis